MGKYKFSKTISYDDYHDMEDNLQGICGNCGEIRDNTEADAEDYDCQKCGRDSVLGVMTALDEDVLLIDEEDDSDEESDDYED